MTTGRINQVATFVKDDGRGQNHEGTGPDYIPEGKAIKHSIKRQHMAAYFGPYFALTFLGMRKNKR